MGAPRSVPCRIVALHGFLGHPDDWAPVRLRMPGLWWTAIDLWQLLNPAHVRDWTTLGPAVGRAVAEAADAWPVLPVVLLAYSFGARLLLSAPEAAGRAMGTCFVSCNPGLKADDAKGREARRIADEAWAQRLQDWEPAAFYDAWNRQPALASSTPLAAGDRFPAERATLVRAMRTFSLAGQPDWHRRLAGWPGAALVVAGALDRKYAAIARRFEDTGGALTVRVVPGAGHRVPWDAPDRFVEVLAAWVRDLSLRSGA